MGGGHLRLVVGVQHLHRQLVAVVQVVRYREADPVVAVARPQIQQLLLCFHKTRDVSPLDLRAAPKRVGPSRIVSGLRSGPARTCMAISTPAQTLSPPLRLPAGVPAATQH